MDEKCCIYNCFQHKELEFRKALCNELCNHESDVKYKKMLTFFTIFQKTIYKDISQFHTLLIKCVS
jgi:hypothetical protein